MLRRVYPPHAQTTLAPLPHIRRYSDTTPKPILFRHIRRDSHTHTLANRQSLNEACWPIAGHAITRSNFCSPLSANHIVAVRSQSLLGLAWLESQALRLQHTEKSVCSTLGVHEFPQSNASYRSFGPKAVYRASSFLQPRQQHGGRGIVQFGPVVCDLEGFLCLVGHKHE